MLQNTLKIVRAIRLSRFVRSHYQNFIVGCFSGLSFPFRFSEPSAVHVGGDVEFLPNLGYLSNGRCVLRRNSARPGERIKSCSKRKERSGNTNGSTTGAERCLFGSFVPSALPKTQSRLLSSEVLRQFLRQSMDQRTLKDIAKLRKYRYDSIKLMLA